MFFKKRYPEKLSAMPHNSKFQQFWCKFIDLHQQKCNKNKGKKENGKKTECPNYLTNMFK